MSSKKHRKSLRHFYNSLIGAKNDIPKQPDAGLSPAEINQQIEEILENIKDYSVIFPEICSEPIKLGVPLEVSFQIGEDAAQEKRLVFAVLVFNIERYEIQAQLQALQKLQIDKAKKLITAQTIRNKGRATPVLEVVYPTPLGGYAMTPMPIFGWYGKEKIIITEISECPAATFLAGTPHYKFWDMMWVGSYVGRQIDGMEIFERVETA